MNIILNFFLLLFLTKYSTCEWHDGFGPWIIATKGEPWPIPKDRTLYNYYYCLDPSNFEFQIVENNCDILEEAVHRYKKIISMEYQAALKQYPLMEKNDQKAIKDSTSCKGMLQNLQIKLMQTCEKYPHINSDEMYSLNVSDGTSALLSAKSIWGILRGLETFSQIITTAENESNVVIRGQEINDEPMLPHRGLLLDTSRHFVPVMDILLTLDAMSYNKLNVFHWHIVDDNSFPYESTTYPELSKKGTYHPTMKYTSNDIKNVIEYARMRGIRVVAEFDTPGHTKSWGMAYPELLTVCYDINGKPTGKLGPMNPINKQLYEFMKPLLLEVSELFPDKYVHLGGDEVPFDCWKSNPEVSVFMEKNNISERYEKLEEFYIQRILGMANDLSIKPIVWQEVFDNNVTMQNGTVVHVWTGNWRNELSEITKAGYPALLSACWYLDHVSSGGDWLKYYKCDPLDFNYNSTDQKNLVLGGEACMWGEFVDRTNIHPRIWPRASATAERLWSFEEQDEQTASKRLEEHSCRMNKRGVPAQPPNGPGFCITA